MIPLLHMPGKRLVDAAKRRATSFFPQTGNCALRIQATDEEGRMRSEMKGLTLADRCHHVAFRNYRRMAVEKGELLSWHQSSPKRRHF